MQEVVIRPLRKKGQNTADQHITDELVALNNHLLSPKFASIQIEPYTCDLASLSLPVPQQNSAEEAALAEEVAARLLTYTLVLNKLRLDVNNPPAIIGVKFPRLVMDIAMNAKNRRTQIELMQGLESAPPTLFTQTVRNINVPNRPLLKAIRRLSNYGLLMEFAGGWIMAPSSRLIEGLAA